ncbi:hypothetical protein TNCV_1037741 [Trichonephila clavipes]|nr:hypothetical protein TNCV_1037741 [Trichonephila clavipes]
MYSRSQWYIVIGGDYFEREGHTKYIGALVIPLDELQKALQEKFKALHLLSSLKSDSKPSMVIRWFALILSSTFLKRSSMIYLDIGKCQHDRSPDNRLPHTWNNAWRSAWNIPSVAIRMGMTFCFVLGWRMKRGSTISLPKRRSRQWRGKICHHQSNANPYAKPWIFLGELTEVHQAV